MTKSAVAYRRGNLIFLSPENRTTQGFTVEGPSVVREDLSSVSAETLGKVVTRMLDDSTSGVPHPADWDELTRPLLDLAGVKTWNSFEKGAKCCGITRTDSVITFMPMENRRRQGFQSLDELQFEIPAAASNAEIGEALVKALDLAR